MKQSNKLPPEGGRRLQPSDRQRAKDAERPPPETAPVKQAMWKPRDISVHLDLPADAPTGQFHILNQIQEFYPGPRRREIDSNIKLHDIVATVIFDYDAQVAQYFFSQETTFFEMYTNDRARRLDFVIEKVPWLMTITYRENDAALVQEIDYCYSEEDGWVISGGCIKEGDGERVRMDKEQAEKDSFVIALRMWEAFRIDRLEVHAKKSEEVPDWMVSKQVQAARVER